MINVAPAVTYRHRVQDLPLRAESRAALGDGLLAFRADTSGPLIVAHPEYPGDSRAYRLVDARSLGLAPRNLLH